MVAPLAPGDSLAVGLAYVAGLSLVDILGVDGRVVGWALFGGWFGASFAPRMGAGRALIEFVLASLVSALAATTIAGYLGITDQQPVRFLACAISALFYTLQHHMIARAGLLVDRLLTKWLGAPPSDPPPGGQK